MPPKKELSEKAKGKRKLVVETSDEEEEEHQPPVRYPLRSRERVAAEKRRDEAAKAAKAAGKKLPSEVLGGPSETRESRAKKEREERDAAHRQVLANLTPGGRSFVRKNMRLAELKHTKDRQEVLLRHQRARIREWEVNRVAGKASRRTMELFGYLCGLQNLLNRRADRVLGKDPAVEAAAGKKQRQRAADTAQEIAELEQWLREHEPPEEDLKKQNDEEEEEDGDVDVDEPEGSGSKDKGPPPPPPGGAAGALLLPRGTFSHIEIRV
jgi:hypothetical protein